MCDFASKLVVVSGPSGAGKDTVVRGVLEKDESISLAVSATTRKVRGAEKDGVDYYFLTEEEFLRRVGNGDFIEYAQYGANYYGTLKEDVLKRVDDGKTVVLVIEVQGAENIRKMYPQSHSVFIMPPSREVLEKRLRNRNTESEEAVLKRLAIAESEIEKRVDYDFIVVNDELSVAVDELHKIITENVK